MFGGLAFVLHGNMWCGVEECDLVVRVGPDAYDTALRRGWMVAKGHASHGVLIDFSKKPCYKPADSGMEVGTIKYKCTARVFPPHSPAHEAWSRLGKTLGQSNKRGITNGTGPCEMV